MKKEEALKFQSPIENEKFGSHQEASTSTSQINRQKKVRYLFHSEFTDYL